MSRDVELTVIRGLPGSGKSTYAKRFASDGRAVHFENDAYLMSSGTYAWTPDKARYAASKCFADVMRSLKDGNDVVVSNVFVTKKAVDRYANAAKALGAKVKVIRMTADYGNVHDVPDNVLESMSKSFEDYPGEIIN